MPSRPARPGSGGADGPMAGVGASGVTKRHAASNHGPCADYAAAPEGRHLGPEIENENENENENEIENFCENFRKFQSEIFANFEHTLLKPTITVN